MEFIVRLVQVHETFRKPELEALAILANVKLHIVEYHTDVRRRVYIYTVLEG